MTVSWKSWPKLFHICLLLCSTGALSQTFYLQPLNVTVFQGSDVSFSATVEGNWKVMTWDVQGYLMLTIRDDGNVTISSEQFSARFCSGGGTSCVEFTIHNVTRRQAGEVTCSVLGYYGSKTAQLNVQESGTVNIPGGNVTTVEEQQVEFRCVTTAWYPTPTISWTQNGQAVDSSLYNTTSMKHGDSYNATSVLKFQAVRNTTVECRAAVSTMTNPLSSSVFLVVDPKPPNWTVLIAVVLSFSGCALLALLIIAIIFCYKRRKEKQSNYQDEISRRVRTQSQISSVSVAAQKQGQVNAGYVPEAPKNVAAMELTDNGFFQANGRHIYETPVYISQGGQGYNSTFYPVGGLGFRKHRHVTIV